MPELHCPLDRKAAIGLEDTLRGEAYVSRIVERTSPGEIARGTAFFRRTAGIVRDRPWARTGQRGP